MRNQIITASYGHSYDYGVAPSTAVYSPVCGNILSVKARRLGTSDPACTYHCPNTGQGVFARGLVKANLLFSTYSAARDRIVNETLQSENLYRPNYSDPRIAMEPAVISGDRPCLPVGLATRENTSNPIVNESEGPNVQ